jgi:tetratricopeptide (TPR) repeat protein/predicted Ser/Thr protein kinase
MSVTRSREAAYRIFVDALDVDGEARTRLVEQRCGSDPELRRQVEGLLGVVAQDGLDTGPLRLWPVRPEEPQLGKTFGRFRLVEQIGEGGMGVVYRAERCDSVQQSVAIKLVSSSLATSVQSRFEREAQLLARLEHPSIARLIDAGVEEGRAWIAMEFVRGERIDEYCRGRQLAVRDIVRLLVSLADAVAAAHRLLVVHSDIKPANVLVTPEGLPKLVDFGISTALREAGIPADGSSPTLHMGQLFSPNYAAPEQLSGQALTVATDVFGLGALAYRLLSGVPPYADARTPIAYLLAVTQRDIALPSVAALAAGADKAAQALRGDLDAILSKALQRDPRRRYATAADMQADLKLYLEGRPVRARPPSAGYRAGKFVRRNALVVGLSSLLAVGLLGGGLFATEQMRRIALARDMAARRGEFLEELLKSADPRGGRRDLSVADLLDSATSALDAKLSNEPLVEASMLGLIADTYDGLGRYPQALAASDRQLKLLEAHGAEPLELAHALTSRGEILREQGKWADAEAVMRSAVTLLRPLHAPVELAAALDLFGITLGQNHHEAEAQAIYLEEIALEANGGAALQKRRSYPYAALTTLMAEQGRSAQAMEYGRRALELARQDLPADHQDLLAFQANYAMQLINDRRAAEAEPLLRDVIARETRVSGAQHKDTLLASWVLSEALLELHRNVEAAQLAESAARSLDSLLGADNSYSLSAWRTYAIASCNGPDVDAGLGAALRVETARRRLLPPEDRQVQSAAAAVGLCLFRAGRYAEAEPKLLAAAAGLEAARGLGFRPTRAAYATLRELYAATGRPEDAARMAAKLEPGPR